MIVCVAVFAVQLARGWRGFGEPLDLQVFGAASWPLLREGEWWRLLSYAFVHGTPVHLLMNLLGLFLFGRLAWSPMNALLVVSGAFGLFHRDTVVQAGGYSTGTIGERIDTLHGKPAVVS